jgi:hypothetical protein
MLSVVYAECSTLYVTLSVVFFNVVLGVVMTSVSMSNVIYTERHFFNGVMYVAFLKVMPSVVMPTVIMPVSY